VIRRLFLEQGAVFRDAHGDTPMCCPGRASLLTGLWTHHHGVLRTEALLFDPRVSIATAMRRSGYFTAYAGKYLNGMAAISDKTPPGWSPQPSPRAATTATSRGARAERAGSGSAPEDHATDVLADDAVTFLRQAPADRPIFAILAPFAVHGGYDRDGALGRYGVPAPRHAGDPRCSEIDRYRAPGPDEADVSDKPAYIRRLGRLPPWLARGWPMRTTCETLLSVDQMLGRVVTELVRQGRYGDTLFVLTAGNGMNYGSRRSRSCCRGPPGCAVLQQPPVQTHGRASSRWSISLPLRARSRAADSAPIPPASVGPTGSHSWVPFAPARRHPEMR